MSAKYRLTSVLLLVFAIGVHSGLSLLGIKSKHIRNSADPLGDANENVAASFTLDASSTDLTRLHGRGIKFDVDSLEVAGLDGLFRVTNSNLQFEKGYATWKSTVEENTMSSYHNNKKVLRLDVSSEAGSKPKLDFVGEAVFHDVRLSDAEAMRSVLVNLCRTDRILHPLPVGVIDKVQNAAAVDSCEADISAADLTVGAVQDYIGKLLVAGARLQRDSVASLTQLQELTTSLTVASTSSNQGVGAERSAAEEKERVRVIMTEFEAVVDTLRLDLSNKVKNVASSFDTVQMEWGVVSNQFLAFETNMTAAVNSRVSLAEDALTALTLDFQAHTLSANASVANLSVAVKSQLEDALAAVNQSLTVTQLEARRLQEDAIVNCSASVAALHQVLTEEQAVLRDSLHANWSVTQDVWRSAAEAEWTRLGAALENATGQVDAVRSHVTSLVSQSQLLDESVRTLGAQVADHNVSIDALGKRLVDETSTLRNLAHNSVTGLHEEVMTEFAVSRQEQREAHAQLHTADATIYTAINNISTALSDALLSNITELASASRAYTDSSSDILRNELHRHVNSSAERLALVTTNILNLQAQARFELDNVTQTHWNTTTAAIAELTANTSNVVARSNSILARAIGEVNSTVLILADTTSSLFDAIKVETSQNISDSVAALAAATSQQLSAISAAVNASVLQLQQNSSAEIKHVSEQVAARLAALDDRQLKEAESVAIQAASESGEVRKLISALNTTLSNEIVAVEAALVVGQKKLNSSLNDAVSSLQTQMTTTSDDLRARIASDVVSLNANYSRSLNEVNSNVTLRMSQLRADGERLVSTTFDKVHHQLTALNISRLSDRAADKAEVERSFTTLRNSHAALESKFNTSLPQLHADARALQEELRNGLTTANASALVRWAEFKNDVASKLTAHSDSFDDKVDRMKTRLENADQVLQRSLDETGAALSAAQKGLMKEIQSAQAEAEKGDRAVQSTLEEQLKLTAAQLRTQSAELMSLASASANSSLQAAVQSVRQDYTTELALLRAQTFNNQSIAQAALASMSVSFGIKEQAIYDQLLMVSSAAQRNITALNSVLQVAVDDLKNSATALGASLTTSIQDTNQKQAAALTHLEASIQSASAALQSSNETTHRRISAVEAAVADATKAISSQAQAQSNALQTHVAASTAALDSHWSRTLSLMASESATTLYNITRVRDALSKAQQDGDSFLQASLLSLDRNVSARVGTLELTINAQVAQGRSDAVAAVSVLNISMTNALVDAAAARFQLKDEIKAESALREKEHSNLDGKIVQLVNITDRLRLDLTEQAVLLNATTEQLKVQQTAEFVRLVAQVEERVRSAEVQQLVGAAAVQAVINDTQRLSRAVDTAVGRVSAAELGIATLHGQVDFLVKQNDAFSGYYVNFTTAVLPGLCSQMGTLQQQVGQLEANSQLSTVERAASKAEIAGALSDMRTAQSAAEAGIRDVTARLAETDKRATGSIATLQTQFVSVAVSSNATSNQVNQLDKAVDALSQEMRTLGSQKADFVDTIKRISLLETAQLAAAELARTTERSTAEAMQALRETVSAQTQQLQSLEGLVARQQEELTRLQEENRRLLRETASVGSVEEIRKMLFDMQSQMVTHTGKVLDVLLQPRSAVLVHAPASSENPV